jgi:hypothetical protein
MCMLERERVYARPDCREGENDTSKLREWTPNNILAAADESPWLAWLAWNILSQKAHECSDGLVQLRAFTKYSVTEDHACSTTAENELTPSTDQFLGLVNSFNNFALNPSTQPASYTVVVRTCAACIYARIGT